MNLKELTHLESGNVGTGKWILVFGANWCGPCKFFKAGVLEKVASDVTDVQTKIRYVDCGDFAEVAAQYGVLNVPSTVVLTDGTVIEQCNGALTEVQLTAMVDKQG